MFYKHLLFYLKDPTVLGIISHGQNNDFFPIDCKLVFYYLKYRFCCRGVSEVFLLLALLKFERYPR